MKSLLRSIILISLLAITAVIITRVSKTQQPISRVEQASISKMQQLPEPDYVSSRILIGGDIFLGRGVEWKSKQQAEPYKYPFSKLNTLDKESYQAWMANLECPSTNTHVSLYEQETLLKFNCLPEFLPELARWFDVVSLSNNHTMNVNGSTGLLETREHLEENDIQHFGHFDNSVTTDICEVITVDALLHFTDASQQSAQIPIVMCGYHGVFRVPTDAELKVISSYSEFLPVITMPHMGAEYRPLNDTIRTDVYRKMIDYGADIVAGGHPHWVQNSESYEGKLIVYSMGNLIFDQQFSSEVKRGMMIDITLSMDYDDNLAQWLNLASQCTEFQDDCLEQARLAELSKPNTSFVHNAVITHNPDMLTQLAPESIKNDTLKRLDWENTLEELAL